MLSAVLLFVMVFLAASVAAVPTDAEASRAHLQLHASYVGAWLAYGGYELVLRADGVNIRIDLPAIWLGIAVLTAVYVLKIVRIAARDRRA